MRASHASEKSFDLGDSKLFYPEILTRAIVAMGAECPSSHNLDWPSGVNSAKSTKLRIIPRKEIENEDHEEAGKLRFRQINNNNRLLNINVVHSTVVSEPILCFCTNILSEG